jgi:hypothetical protein
MDSNLLMEAIERLETEEKYSKEIDILSTELTKEREDKCLLWTTIIDLRMAIQLLFDHVDYKTGACYVTDMVGDALPENIIATVREALMESKKNRQKDYNDESARLQQRIDTLEAYIADYCAPTISDKYNETDRLIEEIKESNDLLRSAFMIAKRDGIDTNWEAWRKQLEIALVRQHKMMFGKDKK